MESLAYTAFVLLLLSTPVFSQSWMRYTRYIGDKKYQFSVLEKDLKEMPNWNPEEDSVPISIQEVTQTARTSLKRLVPESLYPCYSLNEITLFKLSNKWLYEVKFDCFEKWFNSGDDDSARFSIFVKMDGSIFEPTITPWNRETDPWVYQVL